MVLLGFRFYLPLLLPLEPLLLAPPKLNALAPPLAPPPRVLPAAAANAVALVRLLVTLPVVACAVTEYVAMKGDLPLSAMALPANGTEPEVSPEPTSDVVTNLPFSVGDIANLPKVLPIGAVGLTPLNRFHT